MSGLEPVIGAAASIGGAGLQAYGAYQGGQSSAELARYRAGIARNNQQIAEQNAEYATLVGRAKGSTQSLKGAAELGRVKAAQAASGIDVNSGSAVDVQASERMANKLDAETIASNAALESYGYRANAQQFEAQENVNEIEANQAERTGLIGAASSLLGNASALSFRWSGGGSNLGSANYSAGTPGGTGAII